MIVGCAIVGGGFCDRAIVRSCGLRSCGSAIVRNGGRAEQERRHSGKRKLCWCGLCVCAGAMRCCVRVWAASALGACVVLTCRNRDMSAKGASGQQRSGERSKRDARTGCFVGRRLANFGGSPGFVGFMFSIFFACFCFVVIVVILIWGTNLLRGVRYLLNLKFMTLKWTHVACLKGCGG